MLIKTVLDCARDSAIAIYERNADCFKILSEILNEHLLRVDGRSDSEIKANKAEHEKSKVKIGLIV